MCANSDWYHIFHLSLLIKSCFVAPRTSSVPRLRGKGLLGRVTYTVRVWNNEHKHNILACILAQVHADPKDGMINPKKTCPCSSRWCLCSMAVTLSYVLWCLLVSKFCFHHMFWLQISFWHTCGSWSTVALFDLVFVLLLHAFPFRLIMWGNIFLLGTWTINFPLSYR